MAENGPPTDDGRHDKEMVYVSKLIATQFGLKNWLAWRLLNAVVILVLVWTLCYILLTGEVLPDGGLFKLVALVILAYVIGTILSYAKLPPLLGMLLTGLCLKGVGWFVLNGVYNDIVAVSRDVALTVILIKAGIGLDAKALKKMSFTVIKLAICPCVAEAVMAAVISHFLTGIPWFWGLLLGFLLSAISPAVVVPTLLNLKERGYGEAKGISTLVIAASSIDDIVSISLFGIFLAIIFSTGGSLTLQILSGPLELIMGLVAGILWGFVSAIFPHKDNSYASAIRVAMIGMGGLIAVLGSKKIDYPGAGPLACITASFVGALLWNIQREGDKTPVANFFSGVWLVMQPILFGLIGAEIDVNKIDPSNVGSGIIIIVVCLIFRICVCFLVLLRGMLNWKEMLFVNLAWLPKATVQAALSPQALELVMKQPNPDPDDIERGTLLLTIAILAIIITAPIGSIAISVSGPYLLSKNDKGGATANHDPPQKPLDEEEAPVKGEPVCPEDDACPV